MLSKLKNGLILILVMGMMAGLIKNANALEDAILAVVNEEVITYKDLNDFINSSYLQLKSEGMSANELKQLLEELNKNGLQQLIELKLILNEARKLKLEVREDNVTKRLEDIKKKYSSEEEFLASVGQNGTTITELKNKIRDQLKVKYTVEHEVKSKIYVNPQEVTNYYDGHKNDFKKPERINLDSIFIGYGNDKNKKIAREKASDALRLLKEGKEFQEAAKQYSGSPSIGVIARGELIPQIENTVFNLKINEVSPPVETENGIYIFKALAVIPSEQAALDDVKDKIYDFLFQTKFKEKYGAWLEKLKKETYVEIKD